MVMERNPRGGTSLKAGLIFLAAFVLLMVGLAGMQEGLAYRRTAAKAEGVVTATPFGGSHPVIRFALPSGEAVEYNQNGFVGGYRIGQRIQVLYDPANPRQTACLNTIGGLLGGYAFVLAFSAILAISGVLMLLIELPGLPLASR